MATSTSEFEILLDRLRGGDEDAAWQLVSDYGPHVVAVVRRRLRRQIRARLDSQDLVQAVWKSFFFDLPGMGEIRSAEQLIRLLVDFAHRKVVDAYRQHLFAERRRAGLESPPPQQDELEQDVAEERGDELPSRRATPSQFAVAREEWQRMLDKRPALHQEIIRRRLLGNSFDSIATTLGISERTARRVIGDLWQEHVHDET